MRYVFILFMNRTNDVAMDMAIEYWKLLLQDRYVYLDLWIEFLRERYNKTIPKDTWNLLYDFIQDIGMDFDQYDENGMPLFTKRRINI